MTLRSLLAAALAALIAACGGSGGGADPSGTPPPPPPALSKTDAWRFLTQATFGPTEASAGRLVSLGYERWLDEQFTAPVTRHLPYVQAQAAPE